MTDEMMPGVVSLPHGWGHHRPGTRMGARARTRASASTISRTRRTSIDSRAPRRSAASR
ncbi:MAG: hypothetical protein U0414_34005 [Polyangiaceae bacterium]